MRSESSLSLSRRRMLAFGIVMLGSTCLNNIFVTYYVELFCYIMDMQSSWFFVGQLIFMIWNTINDPLFGWLSDSFVGRDAGDAGVGESSFAVMMKRAESIRWGGLLWAIAFSIVWFPPNAEESSSALLGLHFAFCLCFYDGLLTFVEVNHSALLAEITTDSKERARCNLVSAGFATVGSMSTFFGHYYWNRDNLDSFRRFCIVVAGLSALTFYACPSLLGNSVGRSNNSRDIDNGDATVSSEIIDAKGDAHKPRHPHLHSRTNVGMSCKTEERSSTLVRAAKKARGTFNMWRVMIDLTKSRNAVVYALIHVLQSFDCTFQKNFFHIFLANFAGDEISPNHQSLFVASSFVLPWLATSGYTALVQSRGLYRTVRDIFNVRLVVIGTCITLVWSRQLPSAWFMCVMLLLNRVLSESVCRLSPLIVTDLVDEDRYLHDRTRTVAATVVGSASSVGKISQSLAPMLGYVLIPNSAVRPPISSHDTPLDVDDVSNAASASPNLGFMIFALLLFIVSCQRFFWTKYTLREKYLKSVKASLRRSSTTVSTPKSIELV